MSQILLETTRFRDEARRAMESLVSSFGETVHLAALERGQIIYLDKVQGTRAVQVAVTAVGRRFPAHTRHARRAAERCGLNLLERLVEFWERQVVVGQEDWTLDVGVELAREKEKAS